MSPDDNKIINNLKNIYINKSIFLLFFDVIPHSLSINTESYNIQLTNCTIHSIASLLCATRYFQAGPLIESLDKAFSSLSISRETTYVREYMCI